MQNTIFVVKGVANTGKTKTIKKVYELLFKKYPNAKKEEEITGGDIRVILTINGVKIGIESQGDPNSRLFKSIELFIKMKCEIIVCATRTRGATCKIVSKQENNYSISWKNKNKSEKGKEDKENLELAELIVEEINKLLS